MASPTTSAPSLAPGSLEPNSPIENEIPTYRAISPMAVASVALGVISALSFTAWFWVGAAVLAVLCGILSLRNLNRFPDALTGRSFAQAGIAMGLVFGVTSLAYSGWSTSSLYSDAKAFALKFNQSMISAQKTEPIETADVLWYMIPSSQRRGITPEDARARLASMVKDSERAKLTDESLRAMFKQANGVPIEFVSVENSAYVDLDAYAAVLFQVGTIEEVTHEHKAGEVHDEKAEKGKSYALISFKGSGGRNNPNRWHVENIVYPYVPNSYVQPVAKPGGDHGHDH